MGFPRPSLACLSPGCACGFLDTLLSLIIAFVEGQISGVPDSLIWTSRSDLCVVQLLSRKNTPVRQSCRSCRSS